MTSQERQFNITSWLILGGGVLFFILFYLLRLPFFGAGAGEILFVTNLLQVISIYFSLAILWNSRMAFILMLTWGLATVACEKVLLSLGLYVLHIEKPMILGNIPYDLYLNYLIPLFGLYALSSFAVSKMSFKKPISRFWLVLAFDALQLFLFMQLDDAADVKNGVIEYTFDSSLNFLGTPLELMPLYVFSYLLILLPVRLYETFVKLPNEAFFYQGKISFPITIGWAMYLLMLVRQLTAQMYVLAVVSGVLLLILTVLILRKRRKYKA